VDAALRWALARSGDVSYRGRCYGFLEDALELAGGIELDGQGTTAKEAALAYGCRTDGPAPRGAYVFFDATGPLDDVIKNWGHIGLSLGDGRIVHAWDVVRADTVATVERLVGPPGWSPLTYLGWAPIERILVNARRRG
jgi:cell wall-associated NlpC family hydrolase